MNGGGFGPTVRHLGCNKRTISSGRPRCSQNQGAKIRGAGEALLHGVGSREGGVRLGGRPAGLGGPARSPQRGFPPPPVESLEERQAGRPGRPASKVVQRPAGWGLYLEVHGVPKIEWCQALYLEPRGEGEGLGGGKVSQTQPAPPFELSRTHPTVAGGGWLESDAPRLLGTPAPEHSSAVIIRVGESPVHRRAAGGVAGLSAEGVI